MNRPIAIETQLCCAQLVPDRELGGASLIALHLARHLQEQDWRCWIGVPPHGQVAARADELGIPTKAIDRKTLFNRSKLRSLFYNLQIAAQLRDPRCHILHLHCPFLHAALRYGTAYAKTIRIAHLHNNIPEQDLRLLVNDPPDAVVACAEFLVERVHKVFDSASKRRPVVRCVRNCVDLSRFAALERADSRKALGLSEDEVMLLIVADIAPHKGHRTAIDTIGELKQRGITAQLWVVGKERNGTEQTESLKAHCEKLGLTSLVKFWGYRNDVPVLMSAADALLLPSHREGLPLAILEAQAAKTPVLASPIAGIPEVILDGQTGYLVELDQSKKYADRIEGLLADARRKCEMTEAAYCNVREHHSWEGYCKQILSLYKELLEGDHDN